ncbi:tbpA [Symbiodinium microadriaticum]|nr:tbpA [Symbiodinium microadriaticum]
MSDASSGDFRILMVVEDRLPWMRERVPLALSFFVVVPDLRTPMMCDHRAGKSFVKVTGSPLLRPSAAPGSPKSLVLEGEDQQQELAIVHDLPEPHEQLPPDVFPVPFIYVCKFNARCELDLKQIAFGIRHAEYNPRKHSSITVRLFNPRVTALIRASGAITLSANAGCASEDDLKRSAKKLARLIQRCGHDGAKFADFAVTSILCKATLGFPVRLDVLASRFRKNALYEPEFFCSCVFRTRQPRCTFLVTAGGKVSISGLRSIEEVKEALRRAYFVFREFRPFLELRSKKKAHLKSIP